MPEIDLLVIGGGIVGLSVAREAVLRGQEVVLAEANAALGMETSSRNSEVIHAGIYYPPDSLKARFCTEGRDRLYRFADEYGVAYRRCGKLIVAAEPAQDAALGAIHERARASGVDDLRYLSSRELADREPDLRGSAALFSPSTGIVDSHGLMMALAGHAESAGATIAVHSRVTRIDRVATGWLISIAGEADPVLTARTVINCAGLSTAQVANVIEGYQSQRPPASEWAKGNYFGYAGSVPFKTLVYPVPEPGGLGIHLTLDLAGRARFGPNVEWTDRIDYSVNTALRHAFARAIRAYWPDLDPERLYPDYAGIRPKAAGRSDPSADFVIETPSDHGLPGIVNLIGIESPGLTAALALAEAAVSSVES